MEQCPWSEFFSSHEEQELHYINGLKEPYLLSRSALM
jgi:hypothetical protein